MLMKQQLLNKRTYTSSNSHPKDLNPGMRPQTDIKFRIMTYLNYSIVILHPNGSKVNLTVGVRSFSRSRAPQTGFICCPTMLAN